MDGLLFLVNLCFLQKLNFLKVDRKVGKFLIHIFIVLTGCDNFWAVSCQIATPNVLFMWYVDIYSLQPVSTHETF